MRRSTRLLSIIFVMTSCATSCTTTFMEFKGECIQQVWMFLSLVVRKRMICDFPPPIDETELRERDAMDVNPFPDLFEKNPADSFDPDLLEKERIREGRQRSLKYEGEDGWSIEYESAPSE